MTPKQRTLYILEHSRGDDLQRAQRAFAGMGYKEMQEQYGQSGRTRQQLVDGYQQAEDELDAAIEWVMSVL
jgi:hypothetical protein